MQTVLFFMILSIIIAHLIGGWGTSLVFFLGEAIIGGGAWGCYTYGIENFLGTVVGIIVTLVVGIAVTATCHSVPR